MTESNAQKRASAKYRESGAVKQVSVKFFPKDHDVYDWIQTKPKKAEYIIGLVRADMEGRR